MQRTPLFHSMIRKEGINKMISDMFLKRASYVKSNTNYEVADTFPFCLDAEVGGQ